MEPAQRLELVQSKSKGGYQFRREQTNAMPRRTVLRLWNAGECNSEASGWKMIPSDILKINLGSYKRVDVDGFDGFRERTTAMTSWWGGDCSGHLSE